MKRITFTTVACSLLFLAAGCAHKEKYAKFENKSSPGYITGTDTTYSQTYNQSTATTPSPSEPSSPQVSTTINQNTAQTQIEPTGSDSALISQVRAALNNDTTLVTIAPSIQVTAQSGTVTLNGNVANDQQKQTIEHLVKGTSGVVTVNNQLQVSPSATGGQSSQSSIYSNSTSQAQSSISSAPSSDTNQSSLSPTSDKPSTRIYSTKEDTNKSGASAGATGEASLGSTNSAQGSFSTQTTPASSDTSSSSLSSTNQDSLGTSASTNKTSSGVGASGEASLGSTNSATGSSSSESKTTSPESKTTSPDSSTSSLSSTNQSSTTGESKDLSATSERPSSRVYSTNASDYSSGRSGQTSGSDSFNLRVQGTTDADQKLADQVRQELRGNTALAGSMPRLRISIDNGKATLRGNVKTDDEKQKIEQAIQKVTGVTSVQNELRVSPSAGQTETNENK